jgi:hypothetical protein
MSASVINLTNLTCASDNPSQRVLDTGALIDAGDVNRQGGPFWFYKGVNPRAAAAAAMGAVIPLADFIATGAAGASLGIGAVVGLYTLNPSDE